MNNTQVAEIVTNRIIEALEQGVAPWKQPWSPVGRPMNAFTKRPYRGVNTWVLSLVGMCQHYADPRWATFNQISKAGGKVRKGEKSTCVVLWKNQTVVTTDKSGDQVEKDIPLMRYFNVFNVEQADELKLPELVVKRPNDPIAEAERIVADMPLAPPIGKGGDRAYYAPKLDKVQVPELEMFSDSEFYYSTLFHELTHSTGHTSRVDRKWGENPDQFQFASDSYSKEELVAEMGASMLCTHAGIDARVAGNNAAYVAHWLGQLRDDRKLLISAASAAQRASDFILTSSELEIEEN